MWTQQLLLITFTFYHTINTQCICRPKVQCAGRVKNPREDSCVLEEGKQGFCCDNVVNPGQVDLDIKTSSRGPSGTNRLEVPQGVSRTQVSNQIEEEQAIVPNTPVQSTNVDKEKEGHQIFNRQRESDEDIRESARVLLHLGEKLLEDEVLFGLRSGLEGLDSENSIEVRDVCSWTVEPSQGGRKPRCTPLDDLYRSIDGSCNNKFQPLFGMSGTPMQRILPSSYGGKSLPRIANNGSQLPSARLVSQSVFLTGDRGNTGGVSAMFMQMGQFIDHDLTHSPAPSVTCCNQNEDGKSWVYPEDPYNGDPDNCFAIKVPDDDKFWGEKRRKCMEMSRSAFAPPLNCKAGQREQMTALTHWLDASNIYGSTEEESEQVRDDEDHSLLRTTRGTSGSRGRQGRDLLPTCAKRGRSATNIEACNNQLCLEPRNGCFYAGDLRVNEQPGLSVMHTVWVREHNRIAKELKNITSWADEKVFQETRKIVIAEWQHIIYNEWLPILLGGEYMKNFNLFPLTEGYSKDYDSNLDPRINNEFAAAAFRFGHSMITSFHPGRNSKGQNTTKYDLKEAFDRPSLLQDDDFVEDTVRGQSQETVPAWDPVFVEDIVNHLFESNDDNDGGLDLTAINIQQGRDHGVPGYNSYRGICASASGDYRQAKDFSDLASSGFLSSNDVRKLRKVYDHVDDIDLFVGGTLEEPHDDAFVGPAFKCIIGDQFIRAKRGDRFWYENEQRGRKQHFSLSQLREIRKSSMARILCDNTDIERVQPLVFRTDGGPDNFFVSCKDGVSIPRLDLSKY